MRQRLKENMLVPYLSILFIVLSLVIQPIDVFLIGLKNIILSDSLLLTDYVHIGGIGPALFNSGLLMLISYVIVRKLNLKVTGAIFAGILTIGGFAFFGKNILNVTIIFLGVLLNAKYKNIKLKSVIVVFLFSTGLSPVSSLIMFGLGLPYLLSIPLGIIIGLFSGFILVEIASHVISFHRGYDLYNVGFASGIITFALFSIIKLTDASYTTHLKYDNEHYPLLLILFVFSCFAFIIIGFLLKEKPITEYKKILKKSGRAVTDFTRKGNQALTMINIGITGLASLIIIMLLGVNINGPVIGGLYTIFGFSAFGKHIRNSIPPMLGVIIIVKLFGLDFSITIILAVIFSTGLAPLSGEYGFIIGILSGMLHLPIVISMAELHGGVLLYSNGFAAAFTAVIITTVITTFKRSDKVVSS